MIKHSSLTTEQMACVYAWLAQLFSRERDDDSLALLQSSEMAEWFAVLKGEPSLEAEVLQLEEKIAALQVREDATLELAADFCSLFRRYPMRRPILKEGRITGSLNDC